VWWIVTHALSPFAEPPNKEGSTVSIAQQQTQLQRRPAVHEGLNYPDEVQAVSAP
jgi:hypothetical protein